MIALPGTLFPSPTSRDRARRPAAHGVGRLRRLALATGACFTVSGAVGWSLGIAVGFGAPAQAQPAPSLPASAPGQGQAGIAELLRSARLWESLGRPDAEYPILQKVLAVDRTHAVALLITAQIDLERGQAEKAQQALATLEGGHPGSREAGELRELLRIYGTEGKRLARLRLITRGRRTVEAATLARELFPEEQPPGMFAGEFAAVLGQDPGFRTHMRKQLEARIASADNDADRAALAQLLGQPVARRAPPVTVASTSVARASTRTAAPPALAAAAPATASVPAKKTRKASGKPAKKGGGKPAAAITELASALPAIPPSPGTAAAQAPAPAGGAGAAGTVVAATTPGPSPAPPASAPDPWAARDQAKELRESGHPDAALALLENTLVQVPDQPWLRYDIARAHVAAGQVPGALAVLGEGLARTPDDPSMRYAAGLVYVAVDRYDDALAMVEGIPEDQRTDGMNELAQRARDGKEDVLARQRPWFETGVMFQHRVATNGISTDRGYEAPLRWNQPIYGGLGFAQIDEVRVDAGTLGASDMPQFGSLALGGPPPATGLSRGTSVAAGWTGDTRRWDLGVVGLGGFAVKNWVGSWRESRSLGTDDATRVSLQLSRRVLTGSRLPYAGAVDPGTGIAWGGVTNTELSGRVSHDFNADWNLASSLSAQLLRGEHVLDNQALQSRTTLERVMARAPGAELRLGAVASLWHYGKDESGSTLGLGDYYSPQRYASLGLSAAIDYDAGPWYVRFRAVPSRSWAHQAGGALYPLDPALEARSGNATTAASTGGGFGQSLHGDWFYRISPTLGVGAWLDIDRSAFYAPTTAMLYLRWTLDGPVRPRTPAAPQPISRW